MQNLKSSFLRVKKIIATQFPEYSHLSINEVEQQGHDNRTYRLGNDMLIRMPTADVYALKVSKEQKLLPQLAKYLTIAIPEPIKMGVPSIDYPYPFSLYKWINGRSANCLQIEGKALEAIAFELVKFLKELQAIRGVDGPHPGQHNWWRGDRIQVYDKDARKQISYLEDIIDAKAALDLWEKACLTKWEKEPVSIHGDFASGNILIQNDKLSGVIDFGGMAIGDPACDLVIAWTYLSNKARDIFVNEMALDQNTWLRARAWALWKATFELCQIEDRGNLKAKVQKKIISEVLTDGA